MKKFIPLLLVTSYLFCGCGSSTEETTTTTTTTDVVVETTKPNLMDNTTEMTSLVTSKMTTSTTTENINDYKKDSAKEKDSKLWAIAISVDNDIASIQEYCSGISNGSTTFPELKALAEQIKSRQYDTRSELIDFNIESVGADYLAFVKNYVSSCIDICENVIDAVNKVDESYLYEAITNINKASNTATSIAINRMSYLEKSGFSSSEISTIMAN